ncbi:hypothetical protein TUM4438_33250 [Shewanella sairae]|uniref:Regulatory protein RecX n=1 Tax=Shewanella sairae TaxID=190310 RepID=A0ABQ4PMT6_9GAMM|nr:RecX family transcriptional regulator [Shewanella sairae]MCL1129444.1 RecX family transcriptional regulator [Shewanella sairae]GIU49500.1 hypothetical protein TUM4438_33250 [Shewanella sairae]
MTQRPPLRQAKTIENVFNSAYWHLGQQDFTINEMRSKLERKTDNQTWIDTVLARLIEAGYLKTDFAFSVRFCELAFSHQLGAIAIKRKLQLRGVAVADIENALEQVSDELAIDSYAMATERLLSKYENFQATNKEKVYTQMTNKGFSKQEIEYALEQHPAKDTLRCKLAVKADKADLATEIIKLFNKGKGETLIFQELKQRLIDVSDFEQTLYQLSIEGRVDFYQSCQAELNKKRYDLSDYKQKSNAYAYLCRKGFSSDEIKQAMSNDEE